MKQIYVTECNWFSKEPRKAQIREICDICERIKTYLVILAHGLHGIHRFFTLPNATGFLKSLARLHIRGICDICERIKNLREIQFATLRILFTMSLVLKFTRSPSRLSANLQ